MLNKHISKNKNINFIKLFKKHNITFLKYFVYVKKRENEILPVGSFLTITSTVMPFLNAFLVCRRSTAVTTGVRREI